MTRPGVVVRELTPALLDDYLRFFDEVAFKDFPWWSSCYCTFFNDPDHDGDSSPAMRDVRRPRAIELVGSGQTHGHLAYVDGQPVGWVNAAPRGSYRMPRHIVRATDDAGERVGSTVCFIVGAAYRGQGVGRALLDAACEAFRRDGLRIAEGYPRTTPPPTTPWEIPAAQHEYHGPMSMYLAAGFRITKQLDGLAVVRKELAPPRA